MTSRPWSKYSKGSSAYMRNHPDEAKAIKAQRGGKKVNGGSSDPMEDVDEETKKAMDEERKKKGICYSSSQPSYLAQELQEFLNVMKSRTTKKTWKNDEVTIPSKCFYSNSSFF